MTRRIGILGDKDSACTGFSVVLGHLARELARYDLEVYYFGRFGCDKGYGEPELHRNYMYVPCEGGVWNQQLVVELIDKFKLDAIFTEDDWYSAEGMKNACWFWKKPFYFHTPIDSIPVQPKGLMLLRDCTAVFVPTVGAQIYLKGQNIPSTYLPHGVDSQYFRPFNVPDRPDNFTFIWIGRDSQRKALGRALLAFIMLLKDGYDASLLIRTDWGTGEAQRTLRYINKQRIPNIIKEQFEDGPHEDVATTYNRGDCFLCTAKAGGFELGVIEAGACGLPVLVTNHTFMNEQVVHGKSGYLISLEKHTRSRYGSIWGAISIPHLYERMKYYLDNSNIAKQHGNYGMVFVNKNYRWSRSGKILYEAITNEANTSLPK